jgi:hypothetical protein
MQQRSSIRQDPFFDAVEGRVVEFSSVETAAPLELIKFNAIFCFHYVYPIFFFTENELRGIALIIQANNMPE